MHDRQFASPWNRLFRHRSTRRGLARLVAGMGAAWSGLSLAASAARKGKKKKKKKPAETCGSDEIACPQGYPAPCCPSINVCCDDRRLGCC